jgi:nucleotide-binding universal stress UspA family protein
MQTIVVGYDETEPAKRALARAAELAEAFGATLVVTSVAPVMLPAGRGIGGAIDPTDPPEAHRVETAQERNADLIVVGTREPNVLERLLGQSVSQSVSHQAHCDVLIVH